MDIEVASMSWLLWIVLIRTLACIYLSKLELSSFPDRYAGVGLLDHMRSITVYANDEILYSVLKHWVNFDATA